MVSRVDKGWYSQNMSRACNLVETNCVIDFDIIRIKARMTRTMTDGPVRGNIQVRVSGTLQTGWPRFWMLFVLINK